jgi:hypothetical protein
MKKQETKKKDKKQTSQSPFVFSQNCLKICEMSKKYQSVNQSANCRLRAPENFCKEQGDATFVNGITIYPPHALTAEPISPQSSQTNFLSEENEKAKTMPAIRRPFTRTYQPFYSPYGPLNTDFYSLQASILDSIKDISTFTMKHQGIQMDPSNLMRAIRLLVQCETALETTENGLQIALPGSKFQYYRPPTSQDTPPRHHKRTR